MSIWFGALLLVAAAAATYLFCIRPMRRGECGMAGPSTQASAKQRELLELRQEVARLRAELTGDATVDQPRGSRPGEHAD
ncbi:MAG: hypothetical protein GEV07_14530 [Streptosporangiales bacterium]|nr:hypothetical protein [Streptosporangiales bacterium]